MTVCQIYTSRKGVKFIEDPDGNLYRWNYTAAVRPTGEPKRNLRPAEGDLRRILAESLTRLGHTVREF